MITALVIIVVLLVVSLFVAMHLMGKKNEREYKQLKIETELDIQDNKEHQMGLREQIKTLSWNNKS